MEHINGIIYHKSEPANKQHTNHSLINCYSLKLLSTMNLQESFKSYVLGAQSDNKYGIMNFKSEKVMLWS